ncbi:MAG: radical SAM protein [Candidatus Rokuibacteriota bacterium]
MPPVRYEEIEAKTVLNPVRGMGFRWSINPYRGCTHGCHYCFARRYHAYFDLTPGDDFTGVIFVKVNAPAVLRAELARPGWRRDPVAVGTATDPYQPIEGRYRLTRRVLEALAESATPTSLVTKGTLVIRDGDVLEDLEARAGATICMSITTLDVDRWRRLEPGTPPPAQRLRAVAALSARGIAAGVLLAPIIPGLTADRANLEAVIHAAADHGARFLGTNVLHLHPGVKEHFTAFLAAEAPQLLPLYQRLYPGSYAPSRIQAEIGALVSELKERYGLGERIRREPPPETERKSIRPLGAEPSSARQLSLGF